MTPFRPVIDGVPDDLHVEGLPSRRTVTIPLAASEDGHRLVAVEVRLWPGTWRGVPMHEFKFAVVVLNESDEPAVIYDRFLAAGYLAGVRHLVVPCVMAAARLLVRVVRPQVIYRATYLTHPSEKALSKHHMITDTIINAGCRVIQAATDHHGRRYWLMVL